MSATRREARMLEHATRDLMARVSLAKQAEDRAPDSIWNDAVDTREEAEQTLASHVCAQLGIAPGDLGILSEMIGYLPCHALRRLAA